MRRNVFGPDTSINTLKICHMPKCYIPNSAVDSDSNTLTKQQKKFKLLLTFST